MYTGFDPNKHSTVLRKKKDGTRVPVPCPEAMVAYNMYMGGVDQGDQARQYYHVRMKCRKFYKYVANFLLDTAITNAFILYREGHPGTKLKVLKFREVLAKQLIGDYISRRRAGRGGHLVKPLSLQHFPTKIPSAKNPAKNRRGKCSLCAEKKKRTDTHWFCRECNVWLCHQGTSEDCYLAWHRRLQ